MLSQINNPQDFKNYSIEQLKELADEIRHRIISVLSVNGGHLSSNLGIVELTIAMHVVFNTPIDKLIFDVSHQTYPHKLLTGRYSEFERIRKYKGLCGFSHPEESVYDHFYAGHAGTALSLALGLAKTRDTFQREEHIVPVIGDATLTCGMVLEALNNLPNDLKRFIVILNDNAMSISNNVGAINHILSHMVGSPSMKEQSMDQDSLSAHNHRWTQTNGVVSSEGFANYPATFFEQYGLNYVGPIDGHDIEKLIATLSSLKKSRSPCLLHVLTTKGKGMPEAMRNPISHHGAKPFNPESGKFLPNPSLKPTFPKVFGRHLLEMGKKDAQIIAVTPAMSYGSCLDSFKEAFPKRCIDVGIAEPHSVTYCGGIAYSRELKVISSIYATFLQRAMDNVFHDICLQHIPVVFAVDRAGISAADGPTHHGIYDIGFLKVMPNMVICQPRDGQVLKELLNVAFEWNLPTAIRYPNMITENDKEPKVNRKLGKGEILALGKDLLIIALGHMNREAMQVHEILKSKGINSSIFDPVFVKPLDETALTQLFETHSMVLTLEEHSLQGGLGNSVNQFLIQNHLSHVRVLNKGIPDLYLQQGSRAELLEEIRLLPEQIVEDVMESFRLEALQMATL